MARVNATVVHSIQIYPLSIPMRREVAHAASQRKVSEPIVMTVELRDGRTGYGETLPRAYVTGETVQSVLAAIESIFVPALLEFHPQSFPEALEAIEGLPWFDEHGRPVAAARAAVELALLDAVLQEYQRDLDAVAQWMGLAGFGRPGSVESVRYSGVLAASDAPSTLRQLRLMYWGGLRHFKLKVGMEGDVERLEAVARYLRNPIARGRASLRVDANGAWNAPQAIAWLERTSNVPIEAIEQPLPRGCEEQLPALRAIRPAKVIHDESLSTMEDAKRLIELGVADAFSIRISKCGGLLPSLRLAGLAQREHIDIQLGCMVGETSILSAAGVRFLQVCPGVRWAEGCFGALLMADDVVTKSVRFGLGGRVPRLPFAYGLGIRVEGSRLERLSQSGVKVFNL